MSTARSRRGSARWAVRAEADVARVDVLIPTSGRIPELAVTLAGLAAQDDPPFRVVISDQSGRPDGVAGASAVAAMLRVLEAQGRAALVLAHPPGRGMAEQRAFLLGEASAPAVLYLDDDVWLEPGTLARMHEALARSGAGFIGSAVQGLSYLDDVRPAERVAFEPWDGPVSPEHVRRGTIEHDRWPLHNAANLAHEAADRGLDDDEWLLYRVAWVGGCVLFDRAALLAAGGFDFWRDLPPAHAGEDVAAEWRVMDAAGGAGILPSGAVHLEAPTTIRDRRVDAPDVLFGDPG